MEKVELCKSKGKYIFTSVSELYTENVLSFTNPLSPRQWGSPAWDAKCEPGMNSPGISCAVFVLRGHWLPVREHRVMYSSLLKCHWSWLPEKRFSNAFKGQFAHAPHGCCVLIKSY